MGAKPPPMKGDSGAKPPQLGNNQFCDRLCFSVLFPAFHHLFTARRLGLTAGKAGKL